MAAAVPIAMAVYGAYEGNKNKKDAQGQANKNKKQAMSQLSPENIQALTRQFYPGMFNQVMPQMQTAMGSAANQAARHGLTGTGAYQQLAAGMPAQYSGMALKGATDQANQTATARAGLIANTPIPQGSNISGSLSQLADAYMLYHAMNGSKSGQTDLQKSQNSNFDYNIPYTINTGDSAMNKNSV
jgi:hypothetical protein